MRRTAALLVTVFVSLGTVSAVAQSGGYGLPRSQDQGQRVADLEAAVNDLHRRVAELEGDGPAPSPAPTPAPTPDPTASPAPAGAWLSGAAGNGAAAGAFGRWRGGAIAMGGTWNDSYDAQTAQWTVQSGNEWGKGQTIPMDVAVGGIYKDRGQSWRQAAQGAYDGRWRTALQRLRDGWGSRAQSGLYVRFAHEFNGSWTDWHVTGPEAADFRSAFCRFDRLREEVLPDAHTVWSPNDGTTSSLGLDVRTAWPGRECADVVGVDSYNQYPWVNTTAAFQSKINGTHSNGAPLGIESWRRQAAAWGVPMALSEWGTNFDPNGAGGGGDAPVYVTELHRWLSQHGGTGPGQVAYEIYFDVENFGTGQFRISNRGGTEAGKAYVGLF